MAEPKDHDHDHVSPGVAQLAGWVALALVNAVFIVVGHRKESPAGVRAAHHFFDAGQLLAAGLLVYAGVELWRRFGPRRAAFGHVLVAVLSMALGAAVLGEDLIGPVADRFGDAAERLVYVPAALAGLAIPCAALAGAVCRRRWYLRSAGAGLALGVAVMNNVVLRGDYRGVHIVLGVAAATLFGACVAGASMPKLGMLSVLQRPIVAWAARVVLVVPAVLAIAVAPSRTVKVELFRTDGAIVAPLLVWQKEHATQRYVTENLWFKRRDKAPKVAASKPPLVERPIVVMVTMDSVRAEVLAKPEYAGKLERLTELAEESVVFTEARAPGSGTVVTFSQVFSGKHHFQLKWGNVGKRALPNKDNSPRFPELLTKGKVQTVTFVSFPPLMPENGVARGFSEATFVPAPPGQELALSEQMMDAALPRIADHDGGPMFLFLHLMDPHHPYDAAGSGSQFDRYVAEAGLCSDAIGRLVDALKEAKLWHRTILIVGADHGEGFKKHGIPFHNIGLYEEILRVPLFIRVPGVEGRRVDTPVTLLDLGPTILDLFGMATPGQFMGESLVPFLRGKNPQLSRPIVSSTLFKANAMYSFPYKVILDRKAQSLEVYDLEADPDERTNLADTKGDEMQGMLETFMQTHALEQR